MLYQSGALPIAYSAMLCFTVLYWARLPGVLARGPMLALRPQPSV